MSKQRNQTQRSKATDEEIGSAAGIEPSLDLVDFEATLQTFNNDNTKLDVCRQIKEYENLIEESTVEGAADDESVEKTQKITLPLSGKVIIAHGNSLKKACELVAAWGKSTRNSSVAIDEQRPSQSANQDESTIRGASVDSFQPKFNAI